MNIFPLVSSKKVVIWGGKKVRMTVHWHRRSREALGGIAFQSFAKNCNDREKFCLLSTYTPVYAGKTLQTSRVEYLFQSISCGLGTNRQGAG